MLVLRSDTLRRRGDLTKEWAEYSLTFEQAKPGPAIRFSSTARPGRRQRPGGRRVARARLGRSPGRLEGAGEGPGGIRLCAGVFCGPVAATRRAGKPAGTFQGGPVTWREKVVFFDKRYDTLRTLSTRKRSRDIWAPMVSRCWKPRRSASG